MPNADAIPLVDLAAQLASIRGEVDEAIAGALDGGQYVLGEEVGRFEEEFAAYCGAPGAVGVASGTDAIHLACRALGIGPGDEVILPAFTFVATALGVSLAGARPVLADVDRSSALIDPEAIEAAVTERTRAILPVHLYGQCADMEPILELARARGLAVIEDAAQAHGARYRGRRAGSLGDVGCFSFYPSKNLGAYGDGGMVTVSEPATAERLERLRNWGSRRKYHHEEMGLNSRLDTLQAAVLRVKLRHLDAWNEARCRLASAYDEALADLEQVEPTRTAVDSVYHLYVVRVADRDARLEELRASGIGAGIHYPFAVHELGACRDLGYRSGAFPVAEDWARRCLTLPIYAEMPAEAIERAVEVLADGVGGSA